MKQMRLLVSKVVANGKDISNVAISCLANEPANLTVQQRTRNARENPLFLGI